MPVRVSLSQKNKARGFKTWYARVFNPESRELKYISLGTDKKTEAQAILSRKMADGEFSRPDVKRLKIRSAIDLFLELKSKTTTAGTITFYTNILEHLAPLYDLDVSDVDQAKIIPVIMRDDISTSYQNSIIALVRELFNFIELDLDFPIKNPLRRIRQKKKIPKFKKAFWEPWQIEKIIDAAPDADYRLFLSVMAFAGFRYTEARNFKPSDFDGKNISVIGKGGKYAKVPVGPRLMAEIERRGPSWDFNFKYDPKHQLQKIVRKALPEGFDASANFHRFRHSFGSNLIRAGANIKAVQLLMRHSSIQMTLNIYSHLLDGDLLQALELLK